MVITFEVEMMVILRCLLTSFGQPVPGLLRQAGRGLKCVVAVHSSVPKPWLNLRSAQKYGTSPLPHVADCEAVPSPDPPLVPGMWLRLRVGFRKDQALESTCGRLSWVGGSHRGVGREEAQQGLPVYGPFLQSALRLGLAQVTFISYLACTVPLGSSYRGTSFSNRSAESTGDFPFPYPPPAPSPRSPQAPFVSFSPAAH